MWYCIKNVYPFAQASTFVLVNHVKESLNLLLLGSVRVAWPISNVSWSIWILISDHHFSMVFPPGPCFWYAASIWIIKLASTYLFHHLGPWLWVPVQCLFSSILITKFILLWVFCMNLLPLPEHFCHPLLVTWDITSCISQWQWWSLPNFYFISLVELTLNSSKSTLLSPVVSKLENIFSTFSSEMSSQIDFRKYHLLF